MPLRENIGDCLVITGRTLAWTVVGLGYAGFGIIFTDSMGWTHVFIPNTVPEPAVIPTEPAPTTPPPITPVPIESVVQREDSEPEAKPEALPMDKTAELNLAELCKYAEKTGSEEICGVKYDIWESRTHDETYKIRARV
jgi:hypothetical protein